MNSGSTFRELGLADRDHWTAHYPYGPSRRVPILPSIGIAARSDRLRALAGLPRPVRRCGSSSRGERASPPPEPTSPSPPRSRWRWSAIDLDRGAAARAVGRLAASAPDAVSPRAAELVEELQVGLAGAGVARTRPVATAPSTKPAPAAISSPTHPSNVVSMPSALSSDACARAERGQRRGRRRRGWRRTRSPRRGGGRRRSRRSGGSPRRRRSSS